MVYPVSARTNARCVVPNRDPRQRSTPQVLQGETPNPVDVPPGCRFHPPGCRFHPPGCRFHPPGCRFHPPGCRFHPPGCRFHPRCPLAEERCPRENPVLRPPAAVVAAGHDAACLLTGVIRH